LALNPGDTIGIIGGGQLGRMLAIAAARLGFKTVVLDPDENAPAFQCSGGSIIAHYEDADALLQLAEISSVITYEFENVNVEAIQKLAGTTPCHPNTLALSTSQDRLVEKRFFNELGIATAPFFEINNSDQLDKALAQTNGSGILKTRRFGYDGKGQVRISPENPDSPKQAVELTEQSACILEGLINFEREISIISARSPSGETRSFDIAENVHRDGILFTSTVPARASAETAKAASSIADKVLNALDYSGVIGIEFFVMADGSLIANEYAPRVHNSGHWTEAACAISQFEQHIRAICDLPLGDPDRHSNCIMQNLIGDEVNQTAELHKKPQTLLHLYGKSETRAGRKMGHFTTIREKSADSV